MTICKLKQTDKKILIQKVGDDLLKRKGRKPYYSQKDVETSLRQQNILMDWDCWAYCFFLSHDSFDAYHKSIGENCDYLSMKQEVIGDITSGASTSWLDFDFDLSWLDWPDFDLSDFFDGF